MWGVRWGQGWRGRRKEMGGGGLGAWGWRLEESTVIGRRVDSLYSALTGPRPEPFLPQFLDVSGKGFHEHWVCRLPPASKP